MWMKMKIKRLQLKRLADTVVAVFLVHLLRRVQAIDGCFYFSALPIFCTYFTLGNCQVLNISKIKQNHESFAETCDSD